MFFSIIVASFNSGDRLRKTVSGILRQTFGDFEIIVKDADSTDGSLRGLPGDPRIRVIRGKDRGIYDGMNLGAAAASGEWIYFLNCGDTLHDDRVLERVRKGIAGAKAQGVLTKDRPWIVYGDVIEKKTGQQVAANPVMSHFAMYRYLPCHQACFYSAELFDGTGFDLSYVVRADYEHFLRSVVTGGTGTLALPEIIADYEGGGFSETPENRRLSRREHRLITRQYFSWQECLLFRLYLIVTLQPVRERLAQSPRTAAVYDRIKNGFYRYRRGGK
jgi:glycosyltransferase involved in cell wall biosynthesis